MTVRKGEPWGTVGPVPPGLVIVRTDRELFDLVNARRAADQAVPPIGLLGGDLCRALGGTGQEERFAGDVPILPVDLVRLEIGSRTVWASAHVIARRWWGWRGELVAVMNGQYAGRADVAPRAHPGDGQVDVVTVAGAMDARARWQAWRRLATGTHVPHASITARRTRALTIELPARTPVTADGRRIARARTFTVTVEPAALTVCV
jgi:putative lipid kinase YegS-like protein